MEGYDDGFKNESLTMENDFEGGRWIDGEFYYERRKEKRRLTKEDNLYGVFKDESDEEDDEDSLTYGLKKKKPKTGGSKYGKEVKFVSGGKQKNRAASDSDEEAEDDANFGFANKRNHGKSLRDEGGSSEDETSPRDEDEVLEDEEEVGEGEQSPDQEMDDGWGPGVRMGGLGGGLGFKTSSPPPPSSSMKKTSSKPRKSDGASSPAGFTKPTMLEPPKKSYTIIKPPPKKKEEPPKEDEQEKKKAKPTGSELPSTFGSKFARSTAGQKSSSQQQGQQKLDVSFLDRKAGSVIERMMAKMGHVAGQGLGKNKQGITTAIEVKVRQKNQGIQDVGERTEQQRMLDKMKEKEEEKVVEKPKRWKKDAKKVKVQYKTVDELISSAGQQSPTGGIQKIEIVDMTGPSGPRVISAEDLKTAPGSAIPMETDEEQKSASYTIVPDLKRAIVRLIGETETAITHLDRKLANQKDSLVMYAHEKEQLTRRLESKDQAASALGEMIAILSTARKNTVPGTPADPSHPPPPPAWSLDQLAEVFEVLQSKYYEEYENYGLGVCAASMAAPLLRRFLDVWRPLSEPLFATSALHSWQKLLQHNKPKSYGGGLHSTFSGKESESDPYSQLVWDSVVPKIRYSLSSEWHTRDTEPAIQLLENWLPLLPRSALSHLLESVVLPKLRDEVDAWNPRVDTLPVHAWIHPWLPLLGERMDQHGLFNTIRFKFGNVLQEWHPSDASAHIILSPWKKVWDAQSWDQFFGRFIIPKLLYAMREFSVNPAQQVLGPFQWVMAWSDLVPIPTMVSILEAEFFPKWFQVLIVWLGGNPNFDELTRWYTGWKQLFPEEILAHERVRAHFARALDMLNSAVANTRSTYGFVQPGVRENLEFLRQTSTSQPSASAAPPPPSSRGTAPRVSSPAHPKGGSSAVPDKDMSFKELVERFAEEQDILFLPKGSARHEGKQLYTFGKITVFLDGNNVYISEDSKWRPLSLDELLQKAQKKR